MTPVWPKDTFLDKTAFYGNFQAKGWQDLNLDHMFPPFRMYYEKKVMKRGILVHEKIVQPLTLIFQEVWDNVGHNQEEADKAGVTDWGGCFNIRKISGSNNWSNHSWACAVDLSPSTNGFNMTTTFSSLVVDAFKRQGARWGGDYKGRKDPMHFEFVSPV